MDAEVKPWGDWWDPVHSFGGIENACGSLYGYRPGVGYVKYVFINECGGSGMATEEEAKAVVLQAFQN